MELLFSENPCEAYRLLTKVRTALLWDDPTTTSRLLIGSLCWLFLFLH